MPWSSMLVVLLTNNTAEAAPPQGLEVGAGVRNALQEEGRIEGAQVIGRYRSGPVSVEGSLYGSWDTLRYSSTDAVIARIIAEQGGGAELTTAADRGAARLMLGLHPWSLGGRGGAPVLYAGAEARYQDRYRLQSEEDGSISLTSLDPDLVAGPSLGAGLEAEVGALGMRLAVYSRPHFDLADGDPTFRHDMTVQLDAFFRPHAQGGAR